MFLLIYLSTINGLRNMGAISLFMTTITRTSCLSNIQKLSILLLLILHIWCECSSFLNICSSSCYTCFFLCIQLAEGPISHSTNNLFWFLDNGKGHSTLLVVLILGRLCLLHFSFFFSFTFLAFIATSKAFNWGVFQCHNVPIIISIFFSTWSCVVAHGNLLIESFQVHISAFHALVEFCRVKSAWERL